MWRTHQRNMAPHGFKIIFPVRLFMLLLMCFCITMEYSFQVSFRFNNSLTQIDHRQLSATVSNLFKLQHTQRVNRQAREENIPVVLILFQNEMWKMAANFQETVSKFSSNHAFLVVRVNSSFSDEDVNIVFQMIQNQAAALSHIAAFLVDPEFQAKLTKRVCSNWRFKWTHLLHTNEWTVVSINPSMQVHVNEIHSLCIDFFTWVITEGDQIVIKRKARRHVKVCRRPSTRAWSTEELCSDFEELTSKDDTLLNGLTLPVAVLPEAKRFIQRVKRQGNITVYSGFGADLMNILSSFWGFNYTTITPSDGGDYGVVYQNGTVSGLAGMLARREVALCNMGMALTLPRKTVLDYAMTPTWFSSVQIMYKLPNPADELDLSYLVIVQPTVWVILLGPGLAMALMAGVTHVATRRLGSCLDHVCFHSSKSYPWQTSRILRASWGMFWVIFSAAYSAYLVTTFAVKSEELKLDSFAVLLNTPKYRFGIPKFSTALAEHMKNSKDPVERKIWERLLEFNKTDPITFSHNVTEHILRVLEGNYALVDYTQRDEIPLYVENADYSEVRSYPVNSLDSLAAGYLTLPKNAFYKDIMEETLVRLHEAGLLRFLREYRLRRGAGISTSKVETQNSVPFRRIEILIYVTSGGIGAAFVFLVIEVIYSNLLPLVSKSD